MMRWVHLFLTLMVVPIGLSAQQPLTSVGLGYPVEPIDGRSAALGGTGIGLFGSTYSLRNPADLLHHPEAGFSLSLASEAVTLDEDQSLKTGRERFTNIRALVPFSDWAASIAFGGVFDQDWSARFLDTLVLADGSAPFEEAREHDGGISTIDVSLARRLGPFGIGVSAQRLTGSLRQSFFRTFELPIGEAPLLNDGGGMREVSYRGWRFKGGASINIADRLLIGGSMSLPTTLTGTVQDTIPNTTDFELPVVYEIGGSFRLVDELLITAATGRSPWADAGDVGEYTTHDVTWVGGGIEFGGLIFLGGRLPLRFGMRRSDLPFSVGADSIIEKAFTGGFGWEFQEGLATADLSLEIGSRGDITGTNIQESFTRMILTLSLRQRSP
tara:strand:- start:153 stop:1307 length:1155 start_codon:yes stop_codon:yes gene_type:complete